MVVKLNIPLINLPEIGNTDCKEHYNTLCTKIDILCSKSSKRNNSFEKFVSIILNHISSIDNLLSIMNSRVFVRPLLYIIKSNNDIDLSIVDRKILHHIDSLYRNGHNIKLSMLSLIELIDIFFIKYDLIPNINTYCLYLRSHLANEDRKLFPNFKKFKTAIDIFIKPDGHIDFVNLAEKKNLPLNDIADFFGIKTSNSRFFELALNKFYLIKLNKLYANEDSNILTEIQDKNIYSKKVSANLYLGNEILKILIDKLLDAGQSPSELWRTTLLAVGGDPRIPKSSPNFVQWWAPLGQKYYEAMFSWLSELDMEVFLTIWKDYALKEGGSDLRRMYPQREYFLRGLFKKKLVKYTRLFLCPEAQRFIEQNFDYKHRPSFTSVMGGDKERALFYINLGNAQIVEGTHNYKLRIFDKLPPNTPLQSFEPIVYYCDLTTELRKQYVWHYGEYTNRFYEIVHHGKWKPKIIRILRDFGYNIREDDIMSRAEFMELTR